MNINWINLSDDDRRTILEQTSVRAGYIVQAVEKDWWVTAVAAKRTFLEKAFLIHELFHQQGVPHRVERMSRHLFDLEKMMNTCPN